MFQHYGLSRREIALCAAAGLPVAAAAWPMVPPLAAVAVGYLGFAVLAIALADQRNFVIPDFLSLPAIPLGLAVAVLESPFDWPAVLRDHGAAALVAAGVLYLLRVAYQRFRGIEGLGLGDVKLAAAAGAWLGLALLPLTLLLATGAALVAVLLRGLWPREHAVTAQTPVPFGSFLAPSILIVWFARRLVA